MCRTHSHLDHGDNEVVERPANCQRGRRNNNAIRVKLTTDQKYELHLIITTKYQVIFLNQRFESVSHAAGNKYTCIYLALNFGTEMK
jgi:hypothetical protein